MLTHVFRRDSQPDTGQVVDSKSSILRIIHREHPTAASLDFVVLETLCHCLQAHCLGHLAQHNFDENTAT